MRRPMTGDELVFAVRSRVSSWNEDKTPDALIADWIREARIDAEPSIINAVVRRVCEREQRRVPQDE